jgi:tetratricopeptide (TPR) repeat protein
MFPMRGFFILSLTLVTFLASGSSAKSQDIQTIKGGVVRIHNSNLKAQGTGFIVHINSTQSQIYIVTSSHVVADVERPDIYLPNKNEPLKGQVLHREEDELRGLAFLTVLGDSKLFAGTHSFELGVSANIVGGESGQVFGFPGGTTIPSVTPANIVRVEGRNLVFTGNMNPGNSGGPLVINGKVIGMVTDVASFSYAIPSDNILLYIKGVEPNVAKEILAKKTKPRPDKVIILVADFRRKQQKSYEVTEAIISQLRNATRGYPDIEVQPLGEHIGIEQGSAVAQAKGSARNANIVLWGTYTTAEDEVLVDVNFEIVQKQRGLDLSHENEIMRAPIAELRKNFNIQTLLSNKMAYLTLLTAGLARFEVDDYDGAISRFTSALAQPDAPDRLSDRGHVFFNRARAYMLKALFSVDDAKVRHDLLGLAIADLNKYISIEKNDGDAYVIRANTYLLANNRDGALADTNKAIELDANNYRGYMIRGLIYLADEDTERSIISINKAIQLMGENVDEDCKVLLYFFRATLHMLKDNYEGAINDFTKAMKTERSLSPFVPYLFLLRGGAYSANGDYDSAVSDFTEAIKLDATNPIFYWARGHAYDENANDVGAADNYTQAITLMNAKGTKQVTFGTQSIDLVDLFRDRARTYEKMEKYDKAISDLQQVSRLTSDSAKRQEAEEKIKELRAKKSFFNQGSRTLVRALDATRRV